VNSKWIIPLVAGVAVGLVAYGFTRNAVCSRPGPDLDRLQDVSFLARELGLSDAQAMEIIRLHTTFGAKTERLLHAPLRRPRALGTGAGRRN